MSNISFEAAAAAHGINVATLQAVAGGAPATPSAAAGTAGTVLEGAAVANCVPAADGTSAGTQLNALLASLRAAGVIAA